MKQLNRYYRCAKISERKMRQIIKYFALDLTADKTAEPVAVTHQSVNRIFLKIRVRVAEKAGRALPFSHITHRILRRFPVILKSGAIPKI